MNFFPHHISTPSRPPNIDLLKIVDCTNKEISWKWWSNSEMIEKTCLLQESITHSTAGFEVFANKKRTFNCFINDASTTIFLRCWDEKKKAAKIVLTVFEQNFAFERFGLHFWENNWLSSNINDQNVWKRCWVKNKKSKYCAHCLRPKVRFWEFRAPFLRK